ncbi:MAG: DNA primase, partial [Ignavibacteriaceae bacterium]
MRIPENKIEEIRSSANIVDVISEYVQLRKRGKNYIGLCPFHNEKTPSFTVSDEKQIFHCFGCHSGGNVFKFLMDYQKISFVEAIQELAQKLGINIDYDEENFTEKQNEQEILYDINSAAGRYFSDNLLNSIDGAFARSYFENRKIKPKTMREFGLGYALPNRDSFIGFAQSKKIDLEKALYLGLIGKNNDGRLYDKFSGRIIFPIFSPNGRVVAFAGRILDKKEGTAKYLNSPESQIYFKGRILYGLSHAKDEIRRLDKAILVEGYMDLISLYQSGIKNVVAVSGTALTDEQAQLLSRYTKNVVLIFDADTAGIKASMRSIEILLKKDMEIKIASLPSGEDPDSFVNNFGREKFEDLIKQAQNFLEYQTAYYEAQGMFTDASKTAEAIRDLVKPIALINDELKRSLLIKSISKKFNLREKLLETELEKRLATLKKEKDLKPSTPRAEKGVQVEKAYDPNISEPIFLNEQEIIKLLFKGEREIVEIIAHNIIEDEYLNNTHKVVATIVYSTFNNNDDLNPASLLSKIPDEIIQEYIRDLIFDKHNVSQKLYELHPPVSEETTNNKLLSDSIRRFKQERITLEIKVYNVYLTKAENEENIEEVREINS